MMITTSENATQNGAAFGMSEAAEVPYRFLIALAVLELLSDAAQRAPVLVVLEDAHWLDRSTADVLAFIARRVEHERIVVLIASREGVEGFFDDAGLPELRLGGLDDAAAESLLEAHGRRLAPAVREQLREQTGGNPLALVLEHLSRPPEEAADPIVARVLVLAGYGVGHLEFAIDALTVAVDRLRAQGRLSLLAQAIVTRALTGVQLGRFDLAVTDAEEGRRLATEAGWALFAEIAHAVQALLAALRGDAEEVETIAAEVERAMVPRRAKAVLVGAVPPLMLKTEANPEGTPIEAFDEIRAGVAADRSQFFKDLSEPFYGANRPGSDVSQGVRDAFWLEGMQGGLENELECIKAFSETDFTEDLKKFDVPTLIVHGDDDQIVSIVASALASSKLAKNSRLKIYEGAPRPGRHPQGPTQRRPARILERVRSDRRTPT
jgi:hypothetical protein